MSLSDIVEDFEKEQKRLLAIKIGNSLLELRQQGCKHAEGAIEITTSQYDFVSMRCKICGRMSA